MSWRDNLQGASFRGVPFFVADVDEAGGRRIVQHVYPGRDKPYPEDLGRKDREFTLNVYVLGAEYMTMRDALLAELEKPGPGRLIHPWYGERNVVVDSYRVRQTTRDGGRADFAITFKEGGENLYPAVTADTRLATSEAADLAATEISTSFAEDFVVDAKPQFVADAAVADAEQLLTEIESAVGRVVLVTSRVPSFNSALALFRSDLPPLVQTASSFASRLVALHSSVAALVSDPVARIRTMLDLSTWDTSLTSVTATTASRTRQLANQTAFASATRQLAVVEAAKAGAAATFKSIDGAHALRGDLADRLDEEMLVAGSAHQDNLYVRLTELRSAVVTDITTRAEGLGRLVNVTPVVTEPDVVIAYRLYGDAARATEIGNRNAIRHPGFVPGGTPLRVLADA